MEAPLKTKRRQLAALEKMEKFNMLTRDGKNWLIAATDPFHDDQLELSGYPDLNISGSIVQCVKKSIQVSVPTGITGNWDCHFVLWPMAHATTGTAATLDRGGVISTNSPSVASFKFGGLTALACNTGNPTFFNANSGGATGIYAAGDVSLDDGTDGYMAGTSRIISMGFEVVNTTAALYKQGQVIVYRQPTNAADAISSVQYGTGATWTWQGSYAAWKCPSPPVDIKNAMLLEGSRQWAAEEGCYLVSTMNTLNNFATEPTATMHIITDSEETVTDQGPTACMTTPVFASTFGSQLVPLTNTLAPFNLSGAYFSGLSNQTTFTVNVTWYVERFPTPFDKQLVVLSSPSPGWDQFALELYTSAMCDMPAGVRVSENPLGEWFQDVVNKVANNASPVLNALSVVHPGFGLAGQMAGVIAQATKRSSVPKAPPPPPPVVLKAPPQMIPRQKAPKVKPISVSSAKSKLAKKNLR